MQVAINNFPLKSAHKGRGIGYYAANLIRYLKNDPSLTITEFSSIYEVKGASVVHYPWFDLFFHTLPIRKKFPTVVTIHDVIPLVFPDHYPVGLGGKINFILQKTALRGCKYIITDSISSRKDIVKYLKVEEKKISVVPLAAGEKFRVLKDDAKLLHIRREYNLPERFLLYVGDANWVKNLPFLIEGFKQLLISEDLADIKLVLVGGVFLKNLENINHPELESLKLVNKLIKEYGLGDRIIRPGQLEDDKLVSFYNLAALYIQPSLYEGFGLPLLQAYACGTPVISSNRGSLPEVGDTSAVYFDPQNLRQFVTVATDVLGDPSLRVKLSRLGLEQAAKFSWEKVARETKQVYIKAFKK